MENETNTNTNANTNPKLKLEIQGLALCNFADNIWKVFFPDVKDHDFKIQITKKIGNSDQYTSAFVLPSASKISLTGGNMPSSGTQNPADWTEAIDLSRLHGEPLHLTTDHSKYAGVLTLSGATLVSRKAENPEQFEIWEVLETQKNLVEKKTPANIFAADFQFDTGDSANIKVENDLGFELSLRFEDDVSYEVTFLNDCKGKNCEDILDFKYLYKIIDLTKFQVKRQFELIALADSHKGFPGSRCGGSAASNVDNPDVI